MCAKKQMVLDIEIYFIDIGKGYLGQVVAKDEGWVKTKEFQPNFIFYFLLAYLPHRRNY